MTPVLGFVGLGVMGEPMCRYLAAKTGARVTAFDVNPEPLARLAADGVAAAPSVEALARDADVVFLSLPGGAEVAVGDVVELVSVVGDVGEVCAFAAGVAAATRVAATAATVSARELCMIVCPCPIPGSGPPRRGL